MKSLTPLKISNMAGILNQMTAPFSCLPRERRKDLVNRLNEKIAYYDYEKKENFLRRPSSIARNVLKIKKHSSDMLRLMYDNMDYISYERDALNSIEWFKWEPESYNEYYRGKKKKYYYVSDKNFFNMNS
jgi:hypothetical protein